MSDPTAPWVPKNAPDLKQDFTAAAEGRTHQQETTQQSQSQSDAQTQSLIEQERMEDSPVPTLRPKDAELVKDVHQQVEAEREAFMKAHRIEPDGFGPKL